MRGAWALVVMLAAGSARADDAVRLYNDGRNAYERKDYQVAADDFRRAFDLSHRPALLYNIARALEALQRLDEAVDAYRTYLRVEPDASDRAAIEAQVRALDELIEQRAGRPGPPRPRKPIYRAWWLWTAVGVVAAAGIAVGLGVGLSQNSNPPTATTTAGTFRF
jgi:tetratricopeptide (TPR) repeat protein